MTEEQRAELEKLADDRAMVLDACADLFDEVAQFMEGVAERTFEAYDTARDKPEIHALMRKHRQALGIRDDYKGFARENREDAQIYRSFRTEIARLEAEAVKDGEALEPFANAFASFTDGDGTCLTSSEWEAIRNAVSINDFRKARARLSSRAKDQSQ